LTQERTHVHTVNYEYAMLHRDLGANLRDGIVLLPLSRGEPFSLFRGEKKSRESRLGIKISLGGPLEDCFRQPGAPEAMSIFLGGSKIVFLTK
jgi:hypothetical protein